jgi:hypothetical protein
MVAGAFSAANIGTQAPFKPILDHESISRGSIIQALEGQTQCPLKFS